MWATFLISLSKVIFPHSSSLPAQPHTSCLFVRTKCHSPVLLSHPSSVLSQSLDTKRRSRQYPKDHICYPVLWGRSPVMFQIVRPQLRYPGHNPEGNAQRTGAHRHANPPMNIDSEPMAPRTGCSILVWNVARRVYAFFPESPWSSTLGEDGSHRHVARLDQPACNRYRKGSSRGAHFPVKWRSLPGNVFSLMALEVTKAKTEEVPLSCCTLP